MKILGLSCFYHDAAAALVLNGELVAAASEERFTRVKHDPEFPINAIKFCLERADLTAAQLDAVVFYDKPFTKFDRIVSGYMAEPFRAARAFVMAMPVWLRRKLWIESIISKELSYEGEVLFVPHHLSHAAGAFFESDFDRAAILTVDGVGEWTTASIGIGNNGQVRLLKEMPYPHSVGLLYSAFTNYLGFQVNSSEYKVMGLAPYGKPEFQSLIEEKLVKIHDDGSIHLDMSYFAFSYGLDMINSKFARLFGRPRRRSGEALESFHNNVAASIQAVTEKIMHKMARHAAELTGERNLCLSGGVALNCKANGLLLSEGVFDRMYVQPAAGDSGGAVGAALYAYHKLSGAAKRTQPFFGIGPEYSNQQIHEFLTAEQIPFRQLEFDITLADVAREIAGGKIVGWYQGAMEFGPRALGFRSIVADARDNAMKEKINAAVKYREPFRPFAPAVMQEYAADYFEGVDSSPYMLFNYTVRPEKRGVIPAVTHIDYSSRIQTVTREDNGPFYDLIREFYVKTGVPVVLNTSFNLRGHPIVLTPEEAFATFCSGGIDILVLGCYTIDKRELPLATQSRFLFYATND